MKSISIETPVATTAHDDDDDAQPPKVLESDEELTPEFNDTTITTRQQHVGERKICCSIIFLGLIIGLSIVTINAYFYQSQYCYSPYTPITLSFDGSNIDPVVPPSFEPKIRSFDPTILSGYDICSDLIKDVEESGKYLVNLAIQENMYPSSTTNYHTTHRWRGRTRMSDTEMAEPAAMDASSSEGKSSAPKEAVAAEYDTMSSYDTNNQVDDVDEADITKSDGTNVFLAYGNDVVWMRAITGDIVARVTLPQVVDDYPNVSYWDATTDDNDDDDTMSKHHHHWWEPPSEQHISSLLLDENQKELIAIVSYRSDHNFIFIERDMTASLVYDIKNDDELELKKTMVHRGRYQTARLIDGNVHIVTVVDIYNYPLREIFPRYNYPKLNDYSYRVSAYYQAELHLPKYARQLITELLSDPDGGSSVRDDTCRSILALSDMMNVERRNNETTTLMDPTHGDGQLNSFVQTSSYNSNSTVPHISGAFVPQSSIDVYADDSSLVVAARGWSRDALTNRFADRTYLIEFELTRDDGSGSNVASSKPVAVGTLPGYVLNQFSIDRYGDYLRVATTTREVWGCDELLRSYRLQRPSSSQIAILERPKDNDDNGGGGGWFVTTATLTNLGVNEDIYSVRFFRSKAFVVTFRRIDPFYTIDLSNPRHPFVAGELKIPGFSNYLHLIGKNDEYVLALGRDVDVATGERRGVQISLFDVRDFANPVQIHKTVVDDDDGLWSESAAQSDHLSFRYFSNRLIIPVEGIRWGGEGVEYSYYDGFYIYEVDITNGITAKGNVTHVDGRRSSVWGMWQGGCWSRSYVPARSMVFEGRLMTMKGHVVKMSDGLNDPKEMWEINLDENRTANGTDFECWSWFDGL